MEITSKYENEEMKGRAIGEEEVKDVKDAKGEVKEVQSTTDDVNTTESRRDTPNSNHWNAEQLSSSDINGRNGGALSRQWLNQNVTPGLLRAMRWLVAERYEEFNHSPFRSISN